MKKALLKHILLIISGICALVILTVAALILFSERFIGAENASVSAPLQSENLTANSQIYMDALEQLRNEYANVKTVEMEANATVEIFKPDSTVSGTGKINFVAQNNKYKYVCEVSDNLVDEGLMRNVDILFDGNKFYFFDRESKVVSFQSGEEIRLPCALPNPFFLPVEFLSNDDDNCEGCKMRLQDIKLPIRWAKRASSAVALTDENSNGLMHGLIQFSGGDLNKIPYNYRVRMLGESSDKIQPVSIARVKENGLPLVEILLSDLRTVPGFNKKIPYVVEVGARDASGALTLKTVFTIMSLKINQPLETNSFAPTFPGAEKFWDSENKAFSERQ